MILAIQFKDSMLFFDTFEQHFYVSDAFIYIYFNAYFTSTFEISTLKMRTQNKTCLNVLDLEKFNLPNRI